MKIFKKYSGNFNIATNLPTNTNYGDEQRLKKSDVFKNAHNIHIHTGEKKLKKYKNKLHKRSSASLLANFLGRFCKIFLCAASLSPSKVCHSFSTNLFVILFCPLWSVGHQSSSWGKKRTVMTLPGDLSPVWWIQTQFSKQICLWAKKKRKRKNYVLCRWGQVLYLYPYRFFLSSKLMSPQPFSTLYIILCSLSLHPPRIHKTKKKKR